MEEDDHPTSSCCSATLSPISAKPSNTSSSLVPKQLQESADNVQYSPADLKMDNSVVHALFMMAEARSAVSVLGRCWTELCNQCDQGKKVMELERTCDQVALLLDEEKKVHQEELKQINQDLNLLEDFLRNRKSRLVQKKTETDRKMEDLLRNAWAVGGIEQTDSAAVQCEQQQWHTAAPHQHNGQFLFWAFQWFMLFHQQRVQQMQQQLQNNTNTHGGLGMNSSGRSALTTIRQPTAQQQAKMKKCLFCFEEIHRNAPTCPFCKKKITSKAAKRVRK